MKYDFIKVGALFAGMIPKVYQRVNTKWLRSRIIWRMTVWSFITSDFSEAEVFPTELSPV